MTITELQQRYAAHPNTAVMERLLKDVSVQTIFCGGLCASSASLFSSVLVKQDVCPFVFVLGDLEEAGYFYHDLTQILGQLDKSIILLYLEDKSYEDIAEITGLTVTNVATKLSRIKDKLKKMKKE